MGRRKKKKSIEEIEAIEKLPPQIELNFDLPETEIDFGQVEQLCFIQATMLEIRAKLNCSEQTLETQCQKQFGKSFLDFHTEKKAAGRLLIRQTQFEMMRGQPQVFKQDGKKQYGKGLWQAVEFLAINYLGHSKLPVKTDEKNESKLLADAVDEIILEVNRKTDAP